MTFDFDTPLERRGTDSVKWGYYGDDVLPMWVADMDFRSPEPIIAALRARVEEGVFGYAFDSPDLREAVQTRLADRYGWAIAPGDLLFMPGIVSAFNAVIRAVGQAGDGVLLKTPLYHPFFPAIANAPRALHDVELIRRQNGHIIHYEVDFDALEARITPQTRLFVLCNPHNPVGRVYTRAELERMADICLRHDLIILADEIHADLILEGQHIPIASLSPEVAARTITLIAPSKTFNVPGLGCGLAIVQNPALRAQVAQAAAGIVPHPNALGLVAANVAFRECQPWLDALLVYLRANRDYLVDAVGARFPGVGITCPEGTYLAWLDFRGLGVPEGPFDFFLREAKVALNDGAPFGQGSAGFQRLNFGCPRSLLLEALDRMQAALAAVV